jgi:hypothetical protein
MQRRKKSFMKTPSVSLSKIQPNKINQTQKNDNNNKRVMWNIKAALASIFFLVIQVNLFFHRTEQ